jgi:uncharacterized protein (UPF0548 family)
MIRLSRPSAEELERYRRSRQRMAPTFDTPGQRPEGFRSDHSAVDLGDDPPAFERAKAALRAWAVHRGAGVEIHPPDASLAPDMTVSFTTRQLGLWFLAACRVTEVIDTVTIFGFTYATLPGHPERGEESFTVSHHPGEQVRFEVAATWRPDALVTKLGGPVARLVQRRATQRYLDAMVRCCQPL